MGTNNCKLNNRVIRKVRKCCLPQDDRGDAIVEATILFPIMTMIFAALVLISMYLPTQAALQSAAQYAATTIATVISDTWLFYDEESMSYYTETDRHKLDNVYVSLFKTPDAGSMGGRITETMQARSISPGQGEVTVTCYLNNKVVYKEIIVEASRAYPMPVNLSFIGFPETFIVTAGATAVVQNADEFIRNIDLAVVFARYVSEKFGLNNIGESIKNFTNEVLPLLNR